MSSGRARIPWPCILYPDSWHAHRALAEVASSSGDVATAIEHFERAPALNPDERRTVDGLAKLRDEGGGR